MSTFTSRQALTILKGGVKEYFSEEGKIANIINSLGASPKGGKKVYVIADFSRLQYRTYDERLFPLESDRIIDKILRDTNVNMICCFQLSDFREEYSCMMKEAMVNRHDN